MAPQTTHHESTNKAVPEQNPRLLILRLCYNLLGVCATDECRLNGPATHFLVSQDSKVDKKVQFVRFRTSG